MNDRVLEPNIEDMVRADEWAELEPMADAADLRTLLQRQVDEHLANGGTITSVPMGATAIPLNNPLWSFPVGKASNLSTPELRAEGQARRSRAQSASQRNGTNAIRKTKHSDTGLVKMIDQRLGLAKNKKELLDSLECSDSLLQRLLFTHFPTDERADPYRAMSHHDREKRRVAQIKQALAEGHVGTQNVAKVVNMSLTIVLELDRKHDLQIPRQAPGRKGTIDCDNPMCHVKLTEQAKYCPQCGTITARGLENKHEKLC